MSHFVELVVVEKAEWTWPRKGITLYVPTILTLKLMWCMTLFHTLNNLSKHGLNVEFSISKDVVMGSDS